MAASSPSGVSPTSASAATPTHTPTSTLTPTPTHAHANSSPTDDKLDIASTASPRANRRAKSRLKNFYGMPTEQQQQSGDSADRRMSISEEQQHGDSDVFIKAPLKSMGPNPLTMDSPFFLAETFLSKCVNENTLVELIQKDNELISEIKDIDGNMKTLVYGNYNKFISAADTIRAMKSKVDDMEIQMNQLQSRFAEISSGNNQIQSALSEKRGKVRQLASAHTLLQKLNFVFNLPRKLELCLKHQKYSDAVRMHLQTGRLLEHYNHLDLFRKIQEECSIILIQLGSKIKAKMSKKESTPSEISECTSLLLALNMQPPLELANEYLKLMQTQLSSLKLECQNSIRLLTSVPETPSTMVPPETSNVSIVLSAPSTSPDAATPDSIATLPSPWRSSLDKQGSFSNSSEDIRLAVAHVSLLNKNYLKEISNFVLKFYECFLTEKTNVSSPSSTGPPSSATLDSIARSRLTTDQKKQFEAALFAAVDTLLADYFSIISSFIPIPDDIWSFSPIKSTYVLSTISLEISSMIGLVRLMNMNDRLKMYSFNYISSVANSALGGLKKGFLDDIYKVIENPGDAAVTIDNAVTKLKSNLTEKTFPILEKFADSKLSFLSDDKESLDGVLDLMIDLFENFWTGLANDMKSIYMYKTALQKNNAQLPPPLLSLAYAYASQSLAFQYIERIFLSFTQTVLKSRHPSIDTSYALKKTDARKKLLVVTASGGTVSTTGMGLYTKGSSKFEDGGIGVIDENEHGKNTEVLIKGRDIANGWKLVAQWLVSRYVHMSSNTLSLKVRSYIHRINWFSIDSPTGANGDWEDIMNVLFDFEREIRHIFSDEDYSPDRRDRDSSPKRSKYPSRSSPMQGLSAQSSPLTVSSATTVSPMARPLSRGGLGSSSLGSSSNKPTLSPGNAVVPGRKSTDTLTSMSSSGFDDITKTRRTRSKSHNLGSGGGRLDVMLDHIGKLFDERIEFFGIVDINRFGIWLAIARIVLKCCIEEIRLQTFSKGGLHHIQIDVAIFLARIAGSGIFPRGNDDQSLYGLADELISSAMRRCLDPELLPQETVQSIIQTGGSIADDSLL